MSLKELLQDLWRGWSKEDLISAQDKLRAGDQGPGVLIHVTKREMKALIANPLRTHDRT